MLTVLPAPGFAPPLAAAEPLALPPPLFPEQAPMVRIRNIAPAANRASLWCVMRPPPRPAPRRTRRASSATHLRAATSDLARHAWCGSPAHRGAGRELPPRQGAGLDQGPPPGALRHPVQDDAQQH